MNRLVMMRAFGVGMLVWLLGACAAAPPAREVAAPPPAAPAAPVAPPPAPVPAVIEAPKPAPLPELFESDDFIVTFAKAGDTSASLAATFLGDPARAWVIEDYNELATLSPGQKVIIPRRPWNLAGVESSGYQLVPILCYHNIAPQAKGRLVIAVKTFEEQMRHLKTQGYRVVSLADFLEFASLRRQLPRKTVVLTFDDGWKSFREYAYPILKELGFSATLFIYTDFVGSRSALSWDELRELAREGFDIQAHTKTHEDLRRKPGESDADYARRMEVELAQPQALFQRHLGGSRPILAYPYGAHDDEVIRLVKRYGYAGAFDVRRQGNPSFGQPLAFHRSQIYADMRLEDFVKNLNVFHQETIK